MSNQINQHYERLIEDEVRILGRYGGPLFLVLNPPRETFQIRESHGMYTNFTEDWRDMPAGLEGIAVHRYSDRLLVFASKTCFQRCGYCCRPMNGSTADTNELNNENLDRIVEYMLVHGEIREVILSGGDPLVCSDDRLEYSLERFSSESGLRSFRIHTRAPVFEPGRLNSRLIRILARHNVRVIVHIVHPYELSPETTHAILRLRRAGLPVFNQFPVLRGINDHQDVMGLLLRNLAAMGIMTTSIYVPEPVGDSFGYRVGLERVYRMTDRLKETLPSWMSSFNVCLDTPIGKVRRSHIVNHDSSRHTYLFQRNLRRFEYQDISSKNDPPTDLGSLLYREIDTVTTRNPAPYSSV